MRCIQRGKGPDQDQDQGRGQGRDSRVLKQGWGSTERPLASRTRLRPLTIPKDTHSGCRLMFEKHTLCYFLFATEVLITLKTKQNKKQHT